jgi:hypothetical protein
MEAPVDVFGIEQVPRRHSLGRVQQARPGTPQDCAYPKRRLSSSARAGVVAISRPPTERKHGSPRQLRELSFRRVQVVLHSVDRDLDALVTIVARQDDSDVTVWPVLRNRRLVRLSDQRARWFVGSSNNPTGRASTGRSCGPITIILSPKSKILSMQEHGTSRAPVSR